MFLLLTLLNRFTLHGKEETKTRTLAAALVSILFYTPFHRSFYVNIFRSSDSIPSAFKSYSLTPVSNFGTGLFNDFVYRVKATGEIQADNAGVQT